MSAASAWVIEATDADFEATVLARSREVPVVVDFWAPWCGPCRVIGPILEQLADESKGGFILAKVNTDENPGLSQVFQVQSIPSVMAFRDGAVADAFVGAQPEPVIRSFIEKLLPGEADHLAAEGDRLVRAGRLPEAAARYQAAIEKTADHSGALLGLARIRLEDGDTAAAMEMLDRVPPGPGRDEADRLEAQIRLRGAGGVDEKALAARIAGDPGDLEARFTLAGAAAARGRYEEALTQYLEIVRRDRAFRDDAARKAMVDVFQVLGHDHPLTAQYRSELAKILFA